MPIKLRPGEIAFFPQPFVESEPNLLVITNQRVVQFGDEGLQEIAAKEVSHLGRVSERPFSFLGILAVLVALPLAILGAYMFFTIKAPLPGLPGAQGTPAAPAAAPAVPSQANIGDDPSVGADDDASVLEEDEPAPEGPSTPIFTPGVKRLLFGILGVLGVVLLVAAFVAIKQQRHYVLVRGSTQMVKIRATDKIQQNTILMTISAAKQGAGGGGAPAPAATAKKIDVDDKGDPVKALQDLAMARQTGKIKDDEFQAKREVLLERIRSRKG